jgi:hypothetical protein
VITSAFKSFDFITRKGVGVQVNYPSEIPSAIVKLITDREVYKERCLSFSIRENSLRDEAWAKIVENVKASSKPLDLSSPRKTRKLVFLKEPPEQARIASGSS